MDDKGRLALPSKYGKAKGQAYVVTRGLDDCLFVFLKDEWRRLEKKLMELSLESQRARFYVRQMSSHAEDTNVDAHGRIMIPPTLRALAGLEREVLVIGALTRIELWDPETYREYEKGFGMTFEEVAESLLEERPGARPVGDGADRRRKRTR
jgi:MraZ protein